MLIYSTFYETSYTGKKQLNTKMFKNKINMTAKG